MSNKRRRQTKRLRWRGIDPTTHNAAVAAVKRNRWALSRQSLAWAGLLGSMRVFARSANQVAKEFSSHITNIMAASK